MCCGEDLLDHLAYETWKEVTINKLAIFAFDAGKSVCCASRRSQGTGDLLQVRLSEAVLPGEMVHIYLDVKRNNG
jgi:hypothetical protein